MNCTPFWGVEWGASETTRIETASQWASEHGGTVEEVQRGTTSSLEDSSVDEAWWLERASQFNIDFNGEFHPVQISQYRQIEMPSLWGVTCGGRVLNLRGDWEYEPRPGDRDDNFLYRCRFTTRDEALAAYKLWKRANPDIHPASIKV